MNTILVVSAHPDDMEIGMGGAAAKMAQEGAAITSVVLTDGRRSPNPFGLKPEALASLRQAEAKSAAEILGIREVIFFDFGDLKAAHNYESCRQKLKALLEHLRPVEVFTLHPQMDRHATHRLAGQLTLEALRQLNLSMKAIWAYEVWGLFQKWDRFEDISSFVGKKLRAISEHKSQVACISYGEGVVGLNRWRGIFADPEQSSSPAAFAEVFVRLTQTAESAVEE